MLVHLLYNFEKVCQHDCRAAHNDVEVFPKLHCSTLYVCIIYSMVGRSIADISDPR